jgi:hypothetical protein
VHGRWYGVRGHRFVRPALIVSDGAGAERRLLAELDDKPWVAEDGESWRAAFAVESRQELDDADSLELSVAPNINVALRTGGTNAAGPITATGRVAEEPPAAAAARPAAADPQPEAAAEPKPRAKPKSKSKSTPTPKPDAQAEPEPKQVASAEPEPDGEARSAPEQKAPADPDLPFPTPPRRRRARGVPPPPPPEPAAESTNVAAAPTADAPTAPRRRPVANRAADLERLTTRLSAAEATLEREQGRRDEIEQALERERSEARRTVAELARVKAELELARTAESEAADTAAQLDAARRDNHELRARHESLQADHERTLRTQAELEEKLEARTTELQDARKELTGERRQRRDADSRAAAAAEAGHRPAGFHTAVHTPPPPRTDRPINPSLRRSPWLRLLVVLVIAGVLLAVYLVLHSTVLH